MIFCEPGIGSVETQIDTTGWSKVPAYIHGDNFANTAILMSNSLPILDCNDCGACCLTMGHPRYFWNQSVGSDVDRIWIKLPAYLVREIEDHIESLVDDQSDFGKPCIWFDPEKKNCRHHGHRPQVCRDLDVGSEACLRSRRQFNI